MKNLILLATILALNLNAQNLGILYPEIKKLTGISISKLKNQNCENCFNPISFSMIQLFHNNFEIEYRCFLSNSLEFKNESGSFKDKMSSVNINLSYYLNKNSILTIGEGIQTNRTNSLPSSFTITDSTLLKYTNFIKNGFFFEISKIMYNSKSYIMMFDENPFLNFKYNLKFFSIGSIIPLNQHIWFKIQYSLNIKNNSDNRLIDVSVGYNI